MDYNTLYNWLFFPAMIFVARTCDVSLGTLRGVLAAKGKKKIVPFIGFFEVLIWLVAISSILKNLNNVMCYIGWAGGYAMGIFVGLSIEERLAIGTQVLRIISANQEVSLFTNELKAKNFGYTMHDGEGSRGPVKMIFTVVDRKKTKEVIALLEKYLPTAYYSVEEVRSAAKRSYAAQNSKPAWKNWMLPLR